MGEVIRRLDYYDLIELPSGRHIPVPLAIQRVGLDEVLKIPIAKKKRGWNFYFCEWCAWEKACEWCDDTSCDGEPPCEWAYERGSSFFRCTRHKPIKKYETEVKLAVFEAMIRAGLHEFLRYIEIAPEYKCISKGEIVIEKVSLAHATGVMVDYLW